MIEIGVFLGSSIVTAILFATTLLFGWPTEAVPAWVYFIASAICALMFIIFAMTQRALRLEAERIPKISLKGIEVFKNDGEWFLRVLEENLSITELDSVRAEILEISVEDFGTKQDVERMDLPVQLYTKERLRERIANVDITPARPHRLRPRESKPLEIFQLTRPVGNWVIHFVLPSGRFDLHVASKIEVRCVIYGAGTPVRFSVLYEEQGVDVAVSLSKENLVATKRIIAR